MISQELMSNDWIEVISNDHLKYVQIEEIYKSSILTKESEVESEEVSIDNIRPIPLTPEIIEKNGFVTEEREGDPTFPYFAFIIENDEYRVEITWYDQHEVYEANTGEYLHGAPEVWNMEILGKCGNYDCGKNKLYVHELQHALKLCGIKKNIII